MSERLQLDDQLQALSRFRQAELRFLGNERRRGEPWFDSLFEEEDPNADAVLERLDSLCFRSFDTHFGGERREDPMGSADKLTLLFEYRQAQPTTEHTQVQSNVVSKVAGILLQRTRQEAQRGPGFLGLNRQRHKRAQEELADCEILHGLITKEE